MHLLAAVLLTVTVKAYDSYGVPAPELRTALRVVTATLADAGISVDVIDCGGDARPARCETVADGPGVIVRLAPAPSTAERGDILGAAAIDTAAKRGSLATVYADRIAAQAAAAGCEMGTLLGRAAAHEIGHLLLGTRDHAPRGLMQARWSRTDLQRRFGRDWRFSAAEAAEMQRRLGQRATDGRPPEVALASAATAR